MSIIWFPIFIFGGGGLIALIIFLYDKKHHNNITEYLPNYHDNFALKKDVYTKEEVEKLIEEKLKNGNNGTTESRN